MRVLKVLLTSFTLLIVLVACGGGNGATGDNNDEMPKMVEVDLQVDDRVNPNEPIQFKAFVTQGDENVDDADEVVYEIWNVQDGRETSEMIEAIHSGNGLYEIEHTLTNENVYFVQVHVTARNLHVMPMKHFVVGDLTEEEVKAMLHEYEMKKDDHSNHHNDDSHDTEEENEHNEG